VWIYKGEVFDLHAASQEMREEQQAAPPSRERRDNRDREPREPRNAK
jgi:ribosomal protein S3